MESTMIDDEKKASPGPIEEDGREAQQQQDQQQQQLQFYINELSSVDSIMDPNILNTLKSYLSVGGEPKKAIKLLSESYRGKAEMANLVMDWLSIIGGENSQIHSSNIPFIHHLIVLSDNSSGQILATQCLQRLLVDHFNPSLADSVFSSFTSTPSWLLYLIEDPQWSQILIKLSIQYPSSLILNFAMRTINAQLQQQQHSSNSQNHARNLAVMTAHMQLKTFRTVLESTLDKLLLSISDKSHHMNKQHKDEFIKLASHNEYTYLYTQSLLQTLSSSLLSLSCSSSSSQLIGLFLRRLSQDLSYHIASLQSSSSSSSASHALFDYLLLYTQPHSELSAVLLPFFRALAASNMEGQTATESHNNNNNNIASEPPFSPLSLFSTNLPLLPPSDIIKLHTLYSSPSTAPSVKYLQSAPLLSSFIHSLFSTSTPSEHTSKYIYLLAYISSSSSSLPISSESLSSCIKAITTVLTACTKGWASNPSQTISIIRTYLSQYNILIVITIYFISLSLTDMTYYESSAYTVCTPLLLSLLGEMIAVYPNYHSLLYPLIEKSYILSSQSNAIDPLSLLSHHKQLLSLTIHSILYGYLEAMNRLLSNTSLSRMDHSLIRHTIMLFVSSISPPYSFSLLQEFLRILIHNEVYRALQIPMILMTEIVNSNHIETYNPIQQPPVIQTRAFLSSDTSDSIQMNEIQMQEVSDLALYFIALHSRLSQDIISRQIQSCDLYVVDVAAEESFKVASDVNRQLETFLSMLKSNQA